MFSGLGFGTFCFIVMYRQRDQLNMSAHDDSDQAPIILLLEC